MTLDVALRSCLDDTRMHLFVNEMSVLSADISRDRDKAGSHRLAKRYNEGMSTLRPPTYIVWSTDEIDLADPFQRRWYIQQVLTHGRAEDIRALDLDEIAAALDEIVLPEDVRSLWEQFLGTYCAEK